MPRPRAVCHMMSTLDGRIDGAALEGLPPEYEATAALLGGTAWACGRQTMQQHFAAGVLEPSGRPAGPRPPRVALKAEGYAVSFDTLGRLDWAGAEVGSDHLVSVVSEGADAAHLEKLERIGASFIVAGAEEIDLRKALESLHDDFGISTLLLEGGGHVNASFLQAGLVDEVSLLLAPVVDARRGIATVFDGLEGEGWAPTSLKLRSVEQRPGEILWLRYDVVRPD